MKILYVGGLDEGRTCLDRKGALQRLGHEVAGFDTALFRSKVRLVQSVQSRWNPRLLLGRVNETLMRFARSQAPFGLVWIDKGVWIFPETLMDLRSSCGCRLLHFTPDPQILTNRSRHFLAAIPHYDCVVTTKSFEVSLYRERGAKRVILTQQSYCPIRYASPRRRPQWEIDVGFVGHYESHYGKAVSALAADVPVHIWGGGWSRAGRLGKIPRAVVRGSGLWGADYVDALASFRIGLGLLSKHVPEQHTTRTFEIPAAGTFLLAERTTEHQSLFLEGQEAEFFGSLDELASKARYYIDNDVARMKIAEQGRERCRRSGYDTDTVLSRILLEFE